MQLIDRYLAGQFVRTFVIFFISITGLYIVVDTFANLDDFLTYVEGEGNLANVLVEYYGYRSLAFFNMTSGLLALIAAMFTVTGFQRTNELTALLAAGVPKKRIVRPIIASAAVVALLAVANREFVVPRVRHKLEGNAQTMVGGTSVLKPRYDYRTGVCFTGARTSHKQKRIDKPSLRLTGELAAYGDTLAAAVATYLPPAEDRPGGYLLKGVTAPADLATRPSLALKDELVFFTPYDAPWLAKDEAFVASDVTFEHLEGAGTWRQHASTAELVAGLGNEALDLGADVRLAVHARFVQPLLDISLLFLGLPIVLARENRNAFAAIGLCGAIVLVFLLVTMTCQALGSGGWIVPTLAAWLPLVIAAPVAAGMAAPLVE